MGQKNKVIPVVGIVDSVRAIRQADGLRRGKVDFLEWRADCLPGIPSLPQARFPWILTVRHPQEGGRGELTATARREAFLRLMENAAMIDLELRSLPTMRRVREEAAAAGIRVIGSFHDFQKTPSAPKLREVLDRASDAGVDIVKIATITSQPSDVARLLDLFARASVPLSVMGMGPLGSPSRLLFAACGSVLNYGWLDQPNVPGQWSALALKEALCSHGPPNVRPLTTKERIPSRVPSRERG
jgi:3-dehydroquinate dehydratase-1